MFDRFTRLDPDVESRAGGGAGLGLALVAALVAGRGGTVAASGTGGGARLEVRWPHLARSPPPPVQRSLARASTGARGVSTNSRESVRLARESRQNLARG